MNQNLAQARESITELQAQVSSLEEQKMNLAWELESVKGTAQFFKRKLDTMRAHLLAASQNRPQEPGLVPEEKKKKLAPSSSLQCANPYVSLSRSSHPAIQEEMSDQSTAVKQEDDDDDHDDDNDAEDPMMEEDPDAPEEKTKKLPAKPSQAPK